MYTLYTGTTGRLLHVNWKFKMTKLKSSLFFRSWHSVSFYVTLRYEAELALFVVKCPLFQAQSDRWPWYQHSHQARNYLVKRLHPYRMEN